MTIMQHAFEQALTPPMPYRVKEYLEKREVGTTFSTAALCEALSIPVDNLSDRNLVGMALAAAAKRKYVTEIDRQGRTVTYRLDKDGEWHVMPRRTSPAAPTITENARTLLSTWPVGSQMSVGSVAVQLGHKKLSKEVSVVRSALWKFVQEGWLESLGGGNFEIIARGDTMRDGEKEENPEFFEDFVKAYEAPPAPTFEHVPPAVVEAMPHGSLAPSARVTEGPPYFEGRVVASSITMIAKDPDLQKVVGQLISLAEHVADMEPPEPHKGLDDYTMDELLDAIALKRMAGGK